MITTCTNCAGTGPFPIADILHGNVPYQLCLECITHYQQLEREERRQYTFRLWHKGVMQSILPRTLS
jgi:hypothetical protein